VQTTEKSEQEKETSRKTPRKKEKMQLSSQQVFKSQKFTAWGGRKRPVMAGSRRKTQGHK